jgi:hypothetical protein
MYLLYYEAQFVQRLAKLGRIDLMAKFKHAYRYIDDLCWVNIGSPQEFLTPEQSRVPENPYWKFDPNQPFRGIHAHFMNLDIQLLQPEQALSEYALCKYDKRRELPFSYTQYIMFQSNRPVRQSYGVAISQTVPIMYLSSSVQHAQHEILNLIATMMRNGFKEERLKTSITHFLSNNTFPGAKFDVQSLIQAIRYLFTALLLYFNTSK